MNGTAGTFHPLLLLDQVAFKIKKVPVFECVRKIDVGNISILKESTNKHFSYQENNTISMEILPVRKSQTFLLKIKSILFHNQL